MISNPKTVFSILMMVSVMMANGPFNTVSATPQDEEGQSFSSTTAPASEPTGVVPQPCYPKCFASEIDPK
ncbi:hypothetical protein BGZ89_004761, partial [Linnemannia elongata]